MLANIIPHKSVIHFKLLGNTSSVHFNSYSFQSITGSQSSPCRSVIVSVLRLRSLLSSSSSACSAISCFSSSILPFSSWPHLSFISLRLTSRLWACFCASTWLFFSRAAASFSAWSTALVSSSYEREPKEGKTFDCRLNWVHAAAKFKRLNEGKEEELKGQAKLACLNMILKWPFLIRVYRSLKLLTRLCNWMVFSLEIWEFWFLFLSSSSWSLRLFTCE